MIETFASLSLPVDEKYELKKNRIQKGTSKTRICIVTGIHGDELEGQYVVYSLQKALENLDFDGIVDIYPCMNPLGMDSIQRKVPMFDLDMNRVFPGDKQGSMVEYMAYKMIQELKDASLVIDIHASNAYLIEVPQIRINEIFEDFLLEPAKHLNVDFIWIHKDNTILKSTLGYCLNKRNVPSLVIEMGIGSRLTYSYGNQIVEGILNCMAYLKMIDKKPVLYPSKIGYDKEIRFLNAKHAGLFITDKKVNTKIHKGERIGQIVDPLQGIVLSDVISQWNGLLFTIRKYPICNEGSLLARVLEVL